MLKKLKAIGLIVIVVAGVVAVLLNNRSKLEAKSNQRVIDSYPVTVEPVQKKELERSLELVGTINGQNDVAVVSEAAGRVLDTYAKVGDYIPQGSVLVQLDGELKLAALKTAEVNYEKAKNDYERYQSLYDQKSITISQLEAAKLNFQSAESQLTFAKREYEDTKITVPISGVVTERMVDKGDYVNKGKVVVQVVDISTLKVKLNVAEKDVFKLKTGDDVTVTTDVYPGVTFKGKIATISDQADNAHTYPVEISLPNSKEHPLKGGMFGRVMFTSIKNNESVTVPREALIGSIKDAKVFVVENGIAKEKNVVIGSTSDNMLEVLSGLKVGEQLVVNGQNNLKDQFKVTIVE
jgi:RND family efflux transporter MFP subunit